MVFLTVIALFVGIIALLVPPVIKEAVELANNAPDLVGRLQRNDQLNKLDDQYHFIEQIQNQLHQKDFWTALFGGVFGAGKAVASGLFSAFTVLVLTLYLTASLPAAKASVYRMVPRTRRQRVTFLSEEISKRVGGYFLGQVGVATLNAVCSYIMMKIVGVPYSAVLAVTVGLFGLIPMVGATIGAIIVVIVAFFDSTRSAVIVVRRPSISYRARCSGLRYSSGLIRSHQGLPASWGLYASRRVEAKLGCKLVAARDFWLK